MTQVINEAKGLLETVTVEQTTFQVLPAPREDLDQILIEGNRAAEQADIDRLVAEGKPTYQPADVAVRFGIPIDVTWTQRDLQRLMQVGDVTYPLLNLRKQATQIHANYVVKGRQALRALMKEVYASYVTASKSPHAKEIVEELKKLVGEKYRASSNTPSLFIRSVFLDFDNKQVHVFSQTLMYALVKNWPVAEFESLVEKNGGFEGVRKLAMDALPKTPEQAEAARKRDIDRSAKADALQQWWAYRRDAHEPMDMPDSLDFADGTELVLRGVVKDGLFFVGQYFTSGATEVFAATDKKLWAGLTAEAEQAGCKKNVVSFIVTRIANPSYQLGSKDVEFMNYQR